MAVLWPELFLACQHWFYGYDHPHALRRPPFHIGLTVYLVAYEATLLKIEQNVKKHSLCSRFTSGYIPRRNRLSAPTRAAGQPSLHSTGSLRTLGSTQVHIRHTGQRMRPLGWCQGMLDTLGNSSAPSRAAGQPLPPSTGSQRTLGSTQVLVH